MRETKSIPEMLGFAAIDPNRTRAFSKMSYQVQYLLYDDEAEDLLREYASDEVHANNAHKKIEDDLNHRFIHNEEYRQRILDMMPQREPEAS